MTSDPQQPAKIWMPAEARAAARTRAESPTHSSNFSSPSRRSNQHSLFASGAKQFVLSLRIGVGCWKRETVLSWPRNQLAAGLHGRAGYDVHHQWTLQFYREGGAGFDTHVRSSGKQH